MSHLRKYNRSDHSYDEDQDYCGGCRKSCDKEVICITGPQGHQGPPGVSTSTAAGFNANDNTQTTVVSGTPITFPNPLTIDPRGIITRLGDSPSVFTVNQTGQYIINYSITGVGDPFLSAGLSVNGALRDKTSTSIQPVPDIISLLSNTITINLDANDNISLIATSSYSLVLTPIGNRNIIITYLGVPN